MRAVPAVTSRLVGRDDELADLARMVGEHRLVTVLGPGGCGKTRLAVELARGRDVHGFVELAAVHPTDALAPAVLDACGLRDEPGTDAPDRLRAGLAASTGLLVIDNCEHVHADVALLVADLLRAAPDLRILTTSRVALALPGEAVLRLAGLAGHAPTLFVDRARAARPDLADEPGVVAEICRLVDGLPLAVELAAALAASLPLPDLRDTMAERLDLLASRHTAGLPQHRSLEASVRWSTELAGAGAATALSALTVVGGRFSFAVARAVTGDIGTVRTLVEHSLLQFAAAEGRYVLLDTVRTHARHDAVTTAAAHDRLLDWVVAFAAVTRAGLERADPAALEQADRDAAAVRSAIEHAIRTGHRLPDAAAAAADLAFAWSLRGRCTEGLDLVRRLAAALDPVPAALGWAHAFLAGYAGDMDTSVALARDVAESAQDDAVRGRALTVTGMVLLFVDPDAAEPLLRDAADLATTTGDDWGRVEALQMLAYTHLLRGAPDQASACADEAAPTLAHLGHGQLRAWDAAIRAEIAAARGRFAEAVAAGRLGLDLAVAVGEPVSAGGAVLPLLRALVATDPGAAPAVLADYRAFARTHPGLGTPEAVALAGAIVASTGPAEAAARAAGDAVAAELAFVAAEAGTLLAVARLRATDTAAAADAAEDALSSAGAHRVLACAARLVGAAAHRGDTDVTPAVHDALTEAHRLGLAPVVADALDLLAALACDTGRLGQASRLLGAAERLRSERGSLPSPLSALLRDEPVVAAVLTGPEHADGLAEGRRLGTEAAVAYASRSRGRRGGRPRAGWASLTPTEQEVVALAAKGLSNPAIGAQLLVTPGTVRTHLRSVFAKLGVSSRAELAALAARRGG